MCGQLFTDHTCTDQFDGLYHASTPLRCVHFRLCQICRAMAYSRLMMPWAGLAHLPTCPCALTWSFKWGYFGLFFSPFPQPREVLPRDKLYNLGKVTSCFAVFMECKILLQRLIVHISSAATHHEHYELHVLPVRQEDVAGTASGHHKIICCR